MKLFYSTVIESILTNDCVVWYNGAKKKDRDTLKKIVKQASRIIGHPIDLDRVCEAKVLQKANSVISKHSHPLNTNYVLMRSGKRWLSMPKLADF